MCFSIFGFNLEDFLLQSAIPSMFDIMIILQKSEMASEDSPELVC